MTKAEKRCMEGALAWAAKKHLKTEGNVTVRVDRNSGELHVFDDGRWIETPRLERIIFDAARHLFADKLREVEEGVTS